MGPPTVRPRPPEAAITWFLSISSLIDCLAFRSLMRLEGWSLKTRVTILLLSPVLTAYEEGTPSDEDRSSAPWMLPSFKAESSLEEEEKYLKTTVE